MGVTFYPHKKLRKNELQDASKKPMKRIPFLPPFASPSVLHAFQVFFLLVLPQKRRLSLDLRQVDLIIIIIINNQYVG